MIQATNRRLQKRGCQFIVLDTRQHLAAQLGADRTFQVTRTKDLTDAFLHAVGESVWIVAPRWTERLVKAASAFFIEHPKQRALGDLFMLAPPRSGVVPSLHGFFRTVVGEVPSFKLLPSEQLPEVLTSEERRDLFIAGCIDEESETATLVRGDFSRLTVPLKLFARTGPTKPDFRQFGLDDYGYALRFGDYEASAHSVLYRVDPDYRRRINNLRRAQEKGFAPSLRRLRLLRGLSRGDVPGISATTIARLERGETGKPHGGTLTRIAKALDVWPEEIESF